VRTCPTCKQKWPTLTGAQVRAIRKRMGWTLREAAALARIHYSYLSKIENGREPVSYQVDGCFRAVMQARP
jgi:DNA-binding transcriptional regulator YiaG